MSEELMRAIMDGTAVAGEDLNPGDELQLGEDGKVYRVHPHGWVRWTCRRPEQGQAIRILGSSERWIADGDTVQTRSGVPFGVPDGAQWKPYVLGDGILMNAQTTCDTDSAWSALVAVSLRDFVKDMKEATRRAGAADPDPDPDPNPWRRLGEWSPPGDSEMEIKGIPAHGAIRSTHGGWLFRTSGYPSIFLTDDAEWRYARP